MKKVLLGLSLLILTCGTVNLRAQNIVNADDENNLSNFYKRTISTTKTALPYPHLRESDVIWETCIWRTIDFREKFNQFFYFPKGTDTNNNNQGRINLAYLIYRNARDGVYEVFEDDELKIPLDWDVVNRKLNKADTTLTDPQYDEYGELIDEGHDTVKYKTFSSDDYFKVNIREYWYIDKQDTRMKVRIVGLALVDENCKEDNEGETSCTPTERFWIPMDDMRVRNVFARANAYDMYNNSIERSYDEIFISRYFDSYITRETNVYNRNIHDYFTGEDAMLESNAIEERIFDIESDMWEY
ncbi:MAG: gliding motility protein GldN [Bacteroidales bacterium]|nr:gliding motility protein GldN [Bacteroidales bacterium]MBP5644762.1 gliding motility protein GldN [Bacteroidales bacterium]